MQTISATDLARRTREILDTVAIQGSTVIVERNERVIARITPEVPHMTASEALAGLERVLTPEEVDAWLKDSRGPVKQPPDFSAPSETGRGGVGVRCGAGRAQAGRSPRAGGQVPGAITLPAG